MLNTYKEKLDTAYYAGSPLIPNEAYDHIFGESDTVGVRQGEVKHLYPLYSLKKHYLEDGALPLQGSLIETPKLDGAAVAVVYRDGCLVQAATRGNGVVGQNVLSKLLHLVPPTIPDSRKEFQVAGEVVARKDLVNSRNLASGSLNVNSLTEFLEKKDDYNLVFIAYSIKESPDYEGWGASYAEDLTQLSTLGFHVITYSDWDEYPHDGIVFRLNSNEKFYAAGWTSKHPRGAIAVKENQKPVVTTLLDVIWQTGKSGRVTPVAILEPVDIGGATVARATLNNPGYIKLLGLNIGCKVEVIRSGEIIPCIVGRAD